MKRIFMLSSHALLCQGIESLLCSDAELEFIGQEADVKNGIKRINELEPDVVIWTMVRQPVTRHWRRSCCSNC